MGLMNGTKASLFYLYMLELAHESVRPYLHVLVMVLEPLLEIGISMFLYFTQDGFLYLLIAGIFVGSHLLIVLLAPESPKYLFVKKKWKELHKVLDLMAKVNCAEQWQGKFYEEVYPEEHKSHEHYSFFEFLKVSSFRRNLILMAVNWSVCSFSFYVISFYLTDFPGSVYLNGSLLGIADLFAAPLSIVSAKYLGYSKSYAAGFSTACVFTIIYAIFESSHAVGYP